MFIPRDMQVQPDSQKLDESAVELTTPPTPSPRSPPLQVPPPLEDEDLASVEDINENVLPEHWVRRSRRLQDKYSSGSVQSQQSSVTIIDSIPSSCGKPEWERKLNSLQELMSGVAGRMSNDNLKTVLGIIQQ